MSGRRAKTLTAEQLNVVLNYVAQNSHEPLRDYVALLLSFRAGLRVGEIAGLSWRDVTDAFGAVRKDAFDVPNEIAKKGSGRSVPMHPALYAALVAWQANLGAEFTDQDAPVVPAVFNVRQRTSPNTLQQYIRRLYARLGLRGCSSHSGRRTLLTEAARKAAAYHCSLRDVQRLAGHRDIETTEAYIEVSAGLAELVRAI